MRLLHWTTLEPQGPSTLAAIRFSSAVIINRLRVFGPNEPVFGNESKILSQTEYPESHEEVVVAMRLFFTATPLVQDKDKPKPSNQLATTTIHYDGGTRDFDIDMGSHSTRLMMLVTWLPRVTVAVYGELASDAAPIKQVSSSNVLSEPIPRSPLPPYLDVAIAPNLIALATSLCLECVGPVSTLHLLRLMFLLKPADSDWEIPDYPVKYADIESLPDLIIDHVNESDPIHPKQRWLEQIMEELRFPVKDGEAEETIELLSTPLGRALGMEEPGVVKHAWLLHVVSNLCKHPPVVAKVAFTRANLIGLIESDLRSNKTLIERLVLCAANPSFADHLRKPSAMTSLMSLQTQAQPSAQALLSSLIARVEGWDVLVKSLTHKDVEFAQVVPWIYDILGDEESFAMFIQGLLEYPAVSDLLKDVPKGGEVKPLFTRCPARVSLVDRKAFMRALVGVASVLPIFCWANSEGRHSALQRVIHAFLIWQQEPGYVDIINRLLSLKQCIWRLFMTVKDCTQGTSLGAERLLYNLYRANTAVLFAPTFLDYLSSRNDDWLPLSEDPWFAKTVVIAQQGTSGVVQLLMQEELQVAMSDPKAVWLVRVLVEGLLREVEKGRDEAVFNSMWESAPPMQGIVPTLVDNLSAITAALKDASYIGCTQSEKTRLSDLFITVQQLLLLISHFGALFPPLDRVIDQLTLALIYYRLASSSLSRNHLDPDSPLLEAQKECDKVFDDFVVLFRRDGFGQGASWRMVKVLLGWAMYPMEEPVEELKQVEYVLDLLLPTRQPMEDDDLECQIWARRIVGQLPLFQAFLRRHAETRSKWVLRLIDIDNGEAGVDEFLLGEEVTQLQLALDRLQEVDPLHPLDYALQFQVYMGFKCLNDLAQVREQLVGHLIGGRLGEGVAKCYASMSSLRLHADSAFALAQHLLQSKQKHLMIAGACAVLRQARVGNDASLPDLVGILKASGGFGRADMGLLVEEIGYNLTAMTSRATIPNEDAKRIVDLMEWLSSNHQEGLVPTLSYPSFQSIQTLVQTSIGEQASNMAALGAELRFGDDEPMDDGTHNVIILSPQCLTPAQMRILVETQGQPRTPPRLATHPALGLVTTSPPTSITRSPISQSLTKTYLNNDFRHLRNLARLNTSRPPSVHVDDFVGLASPMGTVRSAASQASQSAQSSPAAAHAPPFNSLSFIPGLQ